MVNIIGRRVGIQETGPAEQPQGLGQVLAGMGKALYGDTLTPAIKQQQYQALADKNELLKFSLDSVRPDGSFSDPRAAAIATGAGILDPGKMNHQATISDFLREGLDSQTGQRRLAADGKFTATPEYQQRALENNIVLKGIEEQNKLALKDAELREINGPNGPVFARNRDAVGQAPILSSDQVKAGTQQRLMDTIPQERQQDFAFGAPNLGELGVASVNGKTVPAFARQGGFYAVQGNQPIEGTVDTFGKLTAPSADALKPASGDQSALLNRRTAARQATAQIDNLDKLLSQPSADAAVGFIGKSATVFNDIRSQVEATSKLFSPGGLAAETSVPGFQDAVDGAMTKLQANPQFAAKAQALGVQSTVLRSQIIDLAYTIAKAKDPSGRMSNQDIDRAAQILGGALMDPVAGRQVLGTVKQQIMESQNIFEQEYERMYPGKGAQPSGAAPPPPGAAPPDVSSLKQKYGLE